MIGYTRHWLLLFLIIPMVALAQDPWPDRVVQVIYGDGAGFGQEFFPDNILGAPDIDATATQPSADPAEVLSLGSGGDIVLEFSDGGIENGPGDDFIVFENVFWISGDSTRPFQETAFVAVSENTLSWYTFPWNPLTFSGLAGVHPTQGDAISADQRGGDRFDLAAVGLEHARYLRLTDTDDTVPDDGDSFDLDAVMALHGETGNENSTYSSVRVFPNPSRGAVLLLSDYSETLHIYTLQGRQLTRLQVTANQPALWQPDPALPGGVYLLHGDDSGASARLIRIH